MIKDFYLYEEKSKKLQIENSTFLNKFSPELDAILKNEELKEPSYRNESQAVDTSAESFICPLTKKVFESPVMAADGYTYEKVAIEKWLEKEKKSPKTNMPIDANDLRPNHAIKSMIDLFKTEERQLKNLKETERKFLEVF